MKESTQELIDLLLELNEECGEHLYDSINALIIAVESNKRDLQSIKNLSNNVKEWMNNYHSWVNHAVDKLVDSV
jgi:hypothetical protein